MATVSRMCLLVLVLFSCGVVLADQVTDYSITKGDPKVRALEACGDNGTCFSADLSAPGEITSIDYSCSGEACGWVHPCADGGNCNQRADEYAISGSNAMWYGWTNSGNPKAVYRFSIQYR